MYITVIDNDIAKKLLSEQFSFSIKNTRNMSIPNSRKTTPYKVPPIAPTVPKMNSLGSPENPVFQINLCSQKLYEIIRIFQF